MPEPAPLPGEPRPADAMLIQRLRNLADNCLIAGPGDLAEAADALAAQARRVAVLESALAEVVDAWCGEDCDHADVYYAVEGLARSGALSAAFPDRRIWQAPAEAREAVPPEAEA